MSKPKLPGRIDRLFKEIDADVRRTARELGFRRRKPRLESEEDVWWNLRLRRSFGSARLRIFVRADPTHARYDLCNVVAEISFGGVSSDGAWLTMETRSAHVSKVGDVVRQVSARLMPSLFTLRLPTQRRRVPSSAT